ncbi:hypothetical protein ACOME3_002470 [Neoechinorhynchus agilis]
MEFSENSVSQIGVSILNTDLSQLRDECQGLIDDGVDFLHLDVMDGHFVPDITFGSMLISHLRSHFPEIYFDAHLMVKNPDRFVGKMASAGVNRFSFHYETVADYPAMFRLIEQHGMKVGLAVNPSTDIDEVIVVCNDASLVPDCFLIMTVVPGKGGQKLIVSCLDKIRKLREVYGSNINIEVDGGVNLGNVEQCAKAGANLIVSGTGIVHEHDRLHVIEQMREFVEKEFK